MANAVVVKLGAGGKVTIFNSSGASHLIADVAGWHATGREIGSAFTPVAPVRLFDSRATRTVGPGGTVTVRVTDGRPASLTAVALNVTATEPSTGGFLTVYPSGTSRPLASNLNVAAGQTRANFVAVKVANGAVDIYNSNGNTQVVVDLMGYWSPGSESRMTAITRPGCWTPGRAPSASPSAPATTTPCTSQTSSCRGRHRRRSCSTSRPPGRPPAATSP